jgi:flagellar assembly protein FliH
MGAQTASIRPFDFCHSNDFTGHTVVACRHLKDPRRFSQANDGPPPVNDSSTQTTAAPEIARHILQQSASFWEEAEKNLNHTAEALGAACMDISRLRENILRNSTKDMLRLVMVISKQIIQHEVASREELIVSIITEALHAAIKADECHIKINPDDLNVVNDKKPLFLTSISGLKNITFEADPSLARGGCLVESELGEVDATLETKLEKIFQELVGLTDNDAAKSG